MWGLIEHCNWPVVGHNCVSFRVWPRGTLPRVLHLHSCSFPHSMPGQTHELGLPVFAVSPSVSNDQHFPTAPRSSLVIEQSAQFLDHYNLGCTMQISTALSGRRFGGHLQINRVVNSVPRSVGPVRSITSSVKALPPVVGFVATHQATDQELELLESDTVVLSLKDMVEQTEAYRQFQQKIENKVNRMVKFSRYRKRNVCGRGISSIVLVSSRKGAIVYSAMLPPAAACNCNFKTPL